MVLFTVLPTQSRFGFCMHNFLISPMASWTWQWQPGYHGQTAPMCIPRALFTKRDYLSTQWCRTTVTPKFVWHPIDTEALRETLTLSRITLHDMKSLVDKLYIVSGRQQFCIKRLDVHTHTHIYIYIYIYAHHAIVFWPIQMSKGRLKNAHEFFNLGDLKFSTLYKNRIFSMHVYPSMIME